MVRHILFLVLGILCAGMPRVTYAATSLLADIARCTNRSLAENRLTRLEARALRVGRLISINGTKKPLQKGDTIWGLCAAEELSLANARAQAVLAAELIRAHSRATKLQIELTDAKASAGKALEEARVAGEKLAAAGAKLDGAQETARRLWIAIAILGSALILLALAVVALSFWAWRKAIALLEQAARTDRVRETLRSVIPFAILDGVPYTLAPDAVEGTPSRQDRTFVIELTKIVRQGERIEVYCTLPWGQMAPYEPSKILRLLRSEPAQSYYLARRGITLKSDVVGRDLITDDLPDFYPIMAAAAGLSWQREPRLRAASG